MNCSLSSMDATENFFVINLGVDNVILLWANSSGYKEKKMNTLVILHVLLVAPVLSLFQKQRHSQLALIRTRRELSNPALLSNLSLFLLEQQQQEWCLHATRSRSKTSSRNKLKPFIFVIPEAKKFRAHFGNSFWRGFLKKKRRSNVKPFARNSAALSLILLEHAASPPPDFIVQSLSLYWSNNSSKSGASMPPGVEENPPQEIN
ncbi:hypothetical protein CDAR_170601 [Caerostris darwini]|uniref:Uncharacterized protein n=1 Tax=Caerostris darwini TaxID=1538125 RepID=A0AAV4PK40_9ARAC|nr:hypothetical protein CDAR_170601 [Caerostris darwini]